MTKPRSSYNPMRSNTLATKITDEEENCFQAIQVDFPLVKRSSLAALLVLLGCLAYWQRKASGKTLDPQKVLAEVLREAAKHQK